MICLLPGAGREKGKANASKILRRRANETLDGPGWTRATATGHSLNRPFETMVAESLGGLFRLGYSRLGLKQTVPDGAQVPLRRFRFRDRTLPGASPGAVEGVAGYFARRFEGVGHGDFAPTDLNAASRARAPSLRSMVGLQHIGMLN